MTELILEDLEVLAHDVDELNEYLLGVYDREVAPLPRPRAVGPCHRYTDRDGKVTCWHSKDDYDWWIKASGQGFRLTAIQGSWTTSTTASKGTHGGGGAKDCEGDGYTQTEVIRQCKLARDRGLLAWPRFWVNSDGSRNWHMHVLDPMCPNMSPEAQAQVVEFIKGGDGLVGTNPDPLGGYGKTLIASLWEKRFSTVIVPPPTTVTTTTTVSIWPNPSTRLEDVEVRGITTPANAVGTHIFKYSNDEGKTWTVFKPDHLITSGKSLTAATHRFGGNHLVTAEFVPTDKTKFTASKSSPLRVTTIPVQDLATRSEVADLLARITKLEQGSVTPDPPKPVPSFGIDVSGHQSADTVRAEVAKPENTHCIVKATQGLTYVANGWKWGYKELAGEDYLGPYAYAEPPQDPAKEMQHFLDTAQPTSGDVLFIDQEFWDGVANQREDLSPEEEAELARCWLAACLYLHDKTGATPLVYTNWLWIPRVRRGCSVAMWEELVQFPLWLAQYRAIDTYDRVSPKEGSEKGWKVMLHQFTSTPLDRNWTPDINAIKELAIP